MDMVSTNTAEEAETLINVNIPMTPSKPSASVTTANVNQKHSITTIAGTSIIIIGTFLYGMGGIIVRLSMLGKESQPYETTAVMTIAELLKFTITFALLFQQKGVNAAIDTLKQTSLKQWLAFAIPASIYSITNNLQILALEYMDPGSLQVLSQSKILTTAMLWMYWFKTSVSRQQAAALLLLCIGSVCVAWPNTHDATTMYVKWPYGPLLVLTLACFSAIAGVITEWIFKLDQQRSIHIDNLSMYLWGLVVNFLRFYFVAEHRLLHGFNQWTWVLIVLYAVIGLLISQVMKYFDNIVKLFMNGASIIVAGVLTYVVFGLQATWSYMAGVMLVTFAVVLYKSQSKCISL